MLYNIYFDCGGSFNVLGADRSKLDIIVQAYLNGDTIFTISGKEYFIKDLREIQIFTHEIEVTPDEFKKYCKEQGLYNTTMFSNSISPEILSQAGKNVTQDILGHSSYGQNKKPTEVNLHDFIDKVRLEELKEIRSSNFDLSRLIQYCEELNFNFKHGNYLTVAILGRSIINHIPPIFGFTTFNHVANNYGSQSFKKNMEHLNVSMRSIADSFLHETIRKKESLPTVTQVNFSQDLDVLFSEVIRKLNEK